MLTRLKRMLEKVTTDEFILISTVDALPRRFGYPPETDYGANRWAFEDWVKGHFPKVRIIRLPALFGPGLKKNALFDLLNNKPIEVSPWSTFQWYPLTRLWSDIQRIRSEDAVDVNLVTPPLDFGWLQDEVGGKKLYDKTTVTYNVPGPYVITLDEVKAALKEFICSQRTT
jgi:nucleoside-diphosphate-sugar epimerase